MQKLLQCKPEIGHDLGCAPNLAHHKWSSDQINFLAHFPQEHWMEHGGRQSRVFRILDSPYSKKYVLNTVREHLQNALKYRRICGGFEFLCSDEVPLPTLGTLSQDLAAVVLTSSLKRGLWRRL